MHFVEIESLSRKYGPAFALEDISMSISRGEIVTLLGPSGSGKTSLLRNVCGLDFPDSGRIIINQRDVTALPAERRNVGMIFQDLALFPHLTAFDNIAFGLRSKRFSTEQIKKSVREISDQLDITEVLERKPGKISGGQRQRVALARSIVTSPDLLLMDEPLNSLDPELRLDVRNEIKSISGRFDLTIIYVTHDVQEGLYLGDRVGALFDGRLMRIDSRKEMFLNPKNEKLARFFGYNLLDYAGERIGVYPTDLGIVQSDPDITGIVKASGFEGDRYRIYLTTEDGVILQMYLPPESEMESVSVGDRLSLGIKRRISIL